jgi:hypothetical protein
MEFEGRIKELLPLRNGTSSRTGNEWQALPFIFEYFENPSDRYADTVLLETFDDNVIKNLKVGMEVRCGFGHRVRTVQRQDGSSVTFTDMRLYKIESVKKAAVAQQQTQQAAAQPAPAPQPAQQPNPFGPQVNQEGGGDDLPF